MDRERSKLTLCLANMQLPDGPEHALKLVDDNGGRTQPPPSSLGQETAATAFGSMEEAGGRDGERLLAASSLVAAVPHKKRPFAHLISSEDSCLTTGLRRFAMGLPVCRIKHSSSQLKDQVVKFVRKIQNKMYYLFFLNYYLNLALLD
jgi:hypothetical protein